MAVSDATSITAEASIHLRVLITLIMHAPRLAIEFASTIPAYTDLVGFVANFDPDQADRIGTILRIEIDQTLERL
jgi:hypothetical protein